MDVLALPTISLSVVALMKFQNIFTYNLVSEQQTHFTEKRTRQWDDLKGLFDFIMFLLEK